MMHREVFLNENVFCEPDDELVVSCSLKRRMEMFVAEEQVGKTSHGLHPTKCRTSRSSQKVFLSAMNAWQC